MEENKYRTLHTPAAAEDLEAESERSSRALAARVAELERKNQELTERLSQLHTEKRPEIPERPEQPDPKPVPEPPTQPAPERPQSETGRKKGLWPVLALAAVGVTLILILVNGIGPGSSGGQQSSGQPAASESQSQQDGAPEQTHAETATEQPEQGQEEGTNHYYIGICQWIAHESLDEATRGFVDALTDKLGDDVSFIQETTLGDMDSCFELAYEFQSDGMNLLLAVGTRALQAAVSATNMSDGAAPILGTCVTDYAAALGITDWQGVTGMNVSGTCDLVDPGIHTNLLMEMVEANGMYDPVIGLLYDSANTVSVRQCDGVQEELERYGVQCRLYNFSDYASAGAAVSDAATECDILFAASDNIAAADDGEVIRNLLVAANVPLVATDAGTLELCGVVQYEVDYYELGRTTGQMAYEILVNGADVSQMEVQYDSTSVIVKKNDAVEELLGIYIP
ncbi:MAG: ABC transporter substrate-binding protein [Candidatus Onthomonas sp.]